MKIRKGDRVLVEGMISEGEKLHPGIVGKVASLMSDGSVATCSVLQFTFMRGPVWIHDLHVFPNEDRMLEFLVNWRIENAKKPQPEEYPPLMAYLQ